MTGFVVNNGEIYDYELCLAVFVVINRKVVNFSCEDNSKANGRHYRKENKLKVFLGAIHSTKIQTGPTGKRGPPQKVDQFFRNFSGWTEPIH